MRVREVNFDGLIGPTHNYAGLSYGNLAATGNKGNVSRPLDGVLQGIEKAAYVRSLGMKQGMLPPVDRPSLRVLRELGYSGSDTHILTKAWDESPEMVRSLMSASSMWTANACTISPSTDTADGRTHFTAANLASMFHRATECPTTKRVLERYFPAGDRFAHHEPLTGGVHLGDEGAANHNRFCTDYGATGVHLFVYGRRAFESAEALTFPGRQTLEASQAVARQHGLGDRAIFAQQSPLAINAGAFHNDVVAVCNKDTFLYHEQAFVDSSKLKADVQAVMGDTLIKWVEVPAIRVSMEDAVRSYLFNSQLINVPSREGMTLIAPTDAEIIPAVAEYLSDLVESGGPITHVDYMDVRQSMRNGGGPACLRLRVVLDEDDIAAMGARGILDDTLISELKVWANKHYREELSPEDLGDPDLMMESFAALDELTQIMNLGSIYDFQQ